MADFRKWLLAFAAVALLLSLSTSAFAANPFVCAANTGNSTIVRSEGITELVGDIVISCTGGTAALNGAQIPQSNITLSLNTNITSRLNIGGNSGFIDALLLIDEPNPATPNPAGVPLPSNPSNNTVTGAPNPTIQQSAPCFSNTSGIGTSCNNITGTAGTGTGGDPYDPVARPGVTANIFVARQAAANQVVWLGVPIDAPGTTGQRSIRITNIRANACQLGASSSLVPTQITAFIGINGSAGITLTSPQVTVAFIQPGLSSDPPGSLTVTPSTPSTLQQCVNLNTGGGGIGGSFFGSSASGIETFNVRVQEGFAASFKRRVFTGTSAISPGAQPPALSQNIPGANYNTESGFSPGSVAGPFGLADFGTRILVRFNNIGTGTRIVVPVIVPLTVGDTGQGNLVGQQPLQQPSLITGSTFTGGFLQLVAGFSDQFGNSGSGVSGFATGSLTFSNKGTTLGIGGTTVSSAPFNSATEIPVTSGQAFAVYEVVNADPAAVERANIAVGVAFTSNTSQNLPGPGAVTANVSFAPIGPVSTAYNSADAALPIPRFCDQSAAKTVFSILACTCNLLFPFVTNQAGFDTGVAIANTSQDPFGTAPQSGTVVLNYYGSTTGGGAAPAAQTSTVVPAGTELVFTLAGGGTNGITATPGFQGYIIATAKFQFCHAFAFISDLGAQKLAEGYLAIQLDNTGPGVLNRTLITGESMAH